MVQTTTTAASSSSSTTAVSSSVTWPRSLAAAEALRDEKRHALRVLFQRCQALQLEMKEMEKELMALDEHIDELQEEAQEQQQEETRTTARTTARATPIHVKSEPTTTTTTTSRSSSTSSLPQQQHHDDQLHQQDEQASPQRHSIVVESPQSLPQRTLSSSSSPGTTFLSEDVLTDPTTQFTQFTQQQLHSTATATTNANASTTSSMTRPSLVASMMKPAPLELAPSLRKSNTQKHKQQQQQSTTTTQTTLAFATMTKSANSSNSSTAAATVSPSPPPFHRHREAVHRLLRDTFGLTSFRHAQEEIIYATLDRYDVFVVMRTGGGKSLTYQLPALLERPRVTVVVSPLVSLIADQEYQFNQIVNGNNTTTNNSNTTAAVSFTAGLGSTEHARRWNLVRDPTAGVCLVLVTPEKVHKSAKLRGELQRLAAAGRLGRFVIDEAHCASQWGISFRPDYAQLGILKRHFPTVPILAVTATASERVRHDVCHILGLTAARTKVFRSSANRPNLRYAVRLKTNEASSKKNSTSSSMSSSSVVVEDMAAYIQLHHPTHSGIIYTLSRKEADTVAATLDRDFGIPARAYHSDVAPAQKDRIQQLWMNNQLQVVVATIAFGLGINKPNVRFVLHYCISKNLDSYYQESGRAGRDGEPADCILYYSPKVRTLVPTFRVVVCRVFSVSNEGWTRETRNVARFLFSNLLFRNVVLPTGCTSDACHGGRYTRRCC